MKKRNRDKYDFSPETILEKRSFPVKNTLILGILIIAQLCMVLVILYHQPKPQDVIQNYTIYATPQADGSLDIEYRFKWTALDADEELTWVEIGMANEYFTILDGCSGNIKNIKRYSDDDGYCFTRIDFNKAYSGGETVEFYFKVNQERILATNGVETFYEFIPGWFNYIQVKHYSFNFYKYGDIGSFNGNRQDDQWLTWEGSLDYGEFVKMRVNYNSFDAHAVKYQRFNSDGAYNGLAEDKAISTVLMVMLILMLLVVEIVIVDSYVSYSRGRGFLCGYGHHVHVYGRVNPHYQREAAKHNASRGSGSGSRGCACACACACAGGGRAGCSQKDTYRIIKRK